MVSGLHERQHLFEEGVERGVGVARGFRRRPAECRPQLLRVADADRRQLAEPGQAIDDPIHDPVPESAHLVGRERQRLGHARVVPGFRARCRLGRVRWR
jgi:hypothetical protein